MELNIRPATISGKFEDRFGVSTERKLQLREQIADHISVIQKECDKTNAPVDLLKQYSFIAELCTSLEEFAMCMHMFILFAAQRKILPGF